MFSKSFTSQYKIVRFGLLIVALFSFMTLPIAAHINATLNPAANGEESVGKLLFVHGNVSINRAQQTAPAERGTALFNSDTIHTEAASSAQIRFLDDALVAVRPS